MRQLVYTMFISNNRASFHLWWKENLVKHQKVPKYYENDYRHKNSNSPSTKSTRAQRNESYKTWAPYEYVGLEAPEARERWGAKEHIQHKARVARDRLVTRVHKTCEAWEHISYEAHEAREHLGQEAQMYVRDQAQAVPKNARDMVGEVQEYVRHVRHDST